MTASAPTGSPLFHSRVGLLLLSWHGLSLLWALLIGFTSRDGKLALTLLVWTFLAIGLYRLRPRFFLLTGLVLAVLEETLVYSVGGGLHGQAKSLPQDLILTIPVFAGFILGWFLSLKVQPWSETGLYLAAGLHGLLLEFLLTGLILNPVAVLLLGGPVLFIYGSLVLIPSPPQPRAGRHFSLLRAISLWALTLLLMILGAVVADHLL